MSTAHRQKKQKPQKLAKAGAKKSTPPDARPTARLPARQSENAPKRNWAYAEANAPTGDRDIAVRKTAAPPSVGRVYGGENNLTLPGSEKAADAASNERERLKKPGNNAHQTRAAKRKESP
jgi:hypothetical protein